MTLATSSSVVTAFGNGVTTSWPFAFEIPDEDSLEVILTTIATGAEVTVASSAYTVTGLGEAAGGSVTYPLAGSPISSAYSLTIRRNVAYTQDTSIVNQGGFYPQVIEDALDRIVMMIQQFIDLVEQKAHVPYGSDLDPDDVITDHEERIDALEASAVAAGNFVAASQAETLAGTVNTKGITPLALTYIHLPVLPDAYGWTSGGTLSARTTALKAWAADSTKLVKRLNHLTEYTIDRSVAGLVFPAGVILERGAVVQASAAASTALLTLQKRVRQS